MSSGNTMIAQREVREVSWGYRLGRKIKGLVPHVLLIGAAVFAMFPIVMIVMNSFKEKPAIFGKPFMPPLSGTFSLIGYQTVFSRSDFGLYFINSTIVTVSALVMTLWIGSMAAFALGGI